MNDDDDGANDYAPDFESSQKISTLRPQKCATLLSGLRAEKHFPDLVSLDSFDPFSPAREITSPRSLAVCRQHGVLPETLFHKTYIEIKRTCRRFDHR